MIHAILRPLLFGAVYLLFFAGVIEPNAEQLDFRIVDVTTDVDGRARIRYTAAASNYYILYRGTEVSQIVSAADMALGVSVESELQDSIARSSRVFYRVREVPIASPLDTDGDGIDDVWELRFRRPRAALNPNDANEDHTGSGSPDLLDYQLPTASFSELSSTVIATDAAQVQVAVQFSKAFNGTAAVLLGGNAVHGEDFFISGYNGSDQTARVQATGNIAKFTITLRDEPSIDPDRYLLLSLLEPATNAPARYQTSQQGSVTHTLRITDGDLGIYVGLLELTNGPAVDSHSVRLALRSAQGGLADGYFDMTKSSLFRRAFTVPVATTQAGVPTGFPQSIVHVISAPALQRSLTYTLRLGAVSNVHNLEEAFEAPVNLQLNGLSESGKAVVANGQLRLVRIANPQFQP